MAYILDGVIILILIVTVALGYHRGFLRSVVQLVGLVAAFVLAFSLSSVLAEWAYDVAVDKSLRAGIHSALEENNGMDLSEQIEKVKESLPGFVVSVIEQNEDASKALETLGERAETSISTIADVLVTDIIRPLVVAVFRFVSFLLLVALLLLAVKLIAKLIKPITKLPLISQADGLLGALIGLVKAALFILIAVTVMQLLASSGKVITAAQLEETTVVSWIAEHNPVATQLNFN